jgi:hypothetical protein
MSDAQDRYYRKNKERIRLARMDRYWAKVGRAPRRKLKGARAPFPAELRDPGAGRLLTAAELLGEEE